MELNTIYHGDCLDLMKDIEDKSIDLVLTDPPYYQVMKQDHAGIKYDWDNIWDSFGDYLLFMESCFIEFKRILKSNGSFYCFADDKIAAYIQIIGDKYFHLENNIVWYKPNNMPIKGWNDFRSYAPATERILFYSCEVEKTGLQEIYEDKSCFTNIKKYLVDEKEKSKLTNKEFNLLFSEYTNKVGCLDRSVIEHYWQTSQWVFPTKEIYQNVLQSTGFFKREYEELRAEYEELRAEYEELRAEYEELRRPFTPLKNYTDVWEIPITAQSERVGHPTQKPMSIIKRIINTSSRPNAIVFDPFSGSGTTAHACINTGRKFICVEKDDEYYKMGVERVRKAQAQGKLEAWF